MPDFDVAILRGRGNDVVVVGTPSDVKDGAFVAADERCIGIDAAGFRLRQDQESSSSSGLDYDGDELGVDSAEG